MVAGADTRLGGLGRHNRLRAAGTDTQLGGSDRHNKLSAGGTDTQLGRGPTGQAEGGRGPWEKLTKVDKKFDTIKGDRQTDMIGVLKFFVELNQI